jgi:hypothetical protein
MATFFLWMKQDGKGCDYTIGCSELLVELRGATTLEEAKAKVADQLEYFGVDDKDTKLLDAKILTDAVNVMDIVGARISRLRADREESIVAQKRRDLERLKKELGE